MTVLPLLLVAEHASEHVAVHAARVPVAANSAAFALHGV